jgi:hypothetical protein
MESPRHAAVGLKREHIRTLVAGGRETLKSGLNRKKSKFECNRLVSTAERCSDLGKQRTIIGTICGQDGKLLVV